MPWVLVSILLLVALWRTLRLLKNPDVRETTKADWFWCILIFLILLAGRWQWIVASIELNVDESQMIVGAHTLTKDPVFWRSVDGFTSGPMNFFAVIPFGALSAWSGFTHSRVLATFLIGMALWLAYSGIAQLHGRTAARFALIPALVIEALSNASDFNHYSTELFPMALISGAFFLAVRHREKSSVRACGLGGLLLGLVPLAKLQAAPLAGLLGLFWLGSLLSKRFKQPQSSLHPIVYLCIGALLPAGIFAIQLHLVGEWDTMLKAYIQANQHYVSLGVSTIDIMFPVYMAQFVIPYPSSVLVIFVSLLLGAMICSKHLLRAPSALLLSTMSCVVALICVMLPGRLFPHYLQLMILPLTWLCAVLIEAVLKSEHPWYKLALLSPISIYVVLILATRPYDPSMLLFWSKIAYQSNQTLAQRLSAYVKPGEKLAIWGWSSYLYVETKTIQATRQSMSQLMLEKSALLAYFRRQYLKDLQQAKPEAFVDSIGPMSLYYKDPEFRHDKQFPLLRDYIAQNYTLVGEFQQTRIYHRNLHSPPEATATAQ